MFPDKRVEYKLYLAGLVFAAVSAAGIAVLVFTPFKIPDCTFKSVTGFTALGVVVQGLLLLLYKDTGQGLSGIIHLYHIVAYFI